MSQTEELLLQQILIELRKISASLEKSAVPTVDDKINAARQRAENLKNQAHNRKEKEDKNDTRTASRIISSISSAQGPDWDRIAIAGTAPLLTKDKG